MSQGQFKTYQRGRRQYLVDTSFVNGMMYTSGAVDEGFMKTLVNYDIQKDGDTLVPRAGLRVSELILPDVIYENDNEHREYHSNPDITLMASKDCIEQGKSYKQFILGRPAVDEDVGRMWVVTSATPEISISGVANEEDFSIDMTVGKADYVGVPCAYLTTPFTKIHNMPVVPDSKVASIVGTFAFNNSFYFINPETGIAYTEMQEGQDKYTVSSVEPKLIDPSEAVTFGYNMLSGDAAYAFINEHLEGTIQLTGILPYSTKVENELLMTPRHNEEIYLRCYFKGETGKSYKFMWEWRNVGDEDWNTIQSLEQSPTYTIVASESGESVLLSDGTNVLDNLQVVLKAPTENVLVRVQAYSTEDLGTVEKAMTVGFDFGVESYGEANNVKQETYDFRTATGMEFWNNRLVVWGIEKDPTVLFISDVNDPSYFPYPNNISIYDEPIVCVKAFMNSLLVFTTNTVHQVTLNADGTSWNTTLVQSDLNIEPWDRHLIQVVRNMIFFKSGDYYYMLVPKAQASTGKLTLAPISNNMIEFFNRFELNVIEVLQDTFDYRDGLDLINYFNYLDYEDVHNVYVLKCEERFLHFDLLYNVTTRSWRIHTFEAPHYLFPYRQDATKRGTLASTALLNTVLDDGSGTVVEAVEAIREVEYTNIVETDEFVDLWDATEVRVVLQDAYGQSYLDVVLDSCYYDASEDWVGYTNLEGKYNLEYDLTPPANFANMWFRSAEYDLKYGTMMTVYDKKSGDTLFGPQLVTRALHTVYEYPLNLVDDTRLEINGVTYEVTEDERGYYVPTDSDAFEIHGNYVYFKEPVTPAPIINVLSLTEDFEQLMTTGRYIQLYQYDRLVVRDMYVPENTIFKYRLNNDNAYIEYDSEFIANTLPQTIEEATKGLLFNNWQFLDTGYRNNILERNKRYRELQIQLNNLEGSNLEFGLEFQVDGQTRLSHYVYETEHVIDANDPNYGLIYVQAAPYMNLPLEYISTPNETVLGPGTNTWILNQSLFPDLSLWKVRAPVSGKGIAPRMRLLSRNPFRFELMSINWVYRLMNAR